MTRAGTCLSTVIGYEYNGPYSLKMTYSYVRDQHLIKVELCCIRASSHTPGLLTLYNGAAGNKRLWHDGLPAGQRSRLDQSPHLLESQTPGLMRPWATTPKAPILARFLGGA